MAHVISFTTAKFDVSKETPNPINPIAGQSVLAWLRGELARSGYRCSEPDTEDWGWYIGVEGSDASYLVGASADAEESATDVDWILQVHKARSLKEKLFGTNKMTADDPLAACIVEIVRQDAAIRDVVVDRSA